ncbi:MAG: hypothetical protein JXA83_15255 [Acidimicrobiales bacterium]|nr:hypothetical protein [Acidimicrobiales bacterium]
MREPDDARKLAVVAGAPADPDHVEDRPAADGGGPVPVDGRDDDRGDPPGHDGAGSPADMVQAVADFVDALVDREPDADT